MSLIRVARRLLLVIPALVTIACGSDGTGPGTTNNNGSALTANINGAAWAASGSPSAIHPLAGVYSIVGTSTGTNARTLSFTLYNIGGTGTFPLGVTAQMFGGNVTISDLTSTGYATAPNGAAGQIVITSLSNTHMTGTFSFTATPQSGTAANLVVNSGVFDIPVFTSGTIGAPADNAGSKMSGTIGTESFSAAAGASTLTTGSNPTLTINANNGTRNFAISIANMTGPGTYALSAATPVRQVQLSGSPTSQIASWASQVTGGSGTVVITSVTASRIVGTYNATLVPLGGGATGNLLVSGSFDMGRLTP